MTKVKTLPKFTLDSYRELLLDLKDGGYSFRPMANFREPVGDTKRVVYLRHDIDLHIESIDRMAEIEHALGIVSSYFVPLTLHFNPLFPDNANTLRRLVALGHEVGLHYDMETYPQEPAAALAHLDWEAGIVGTLLGRKVRSICMHQPFKGQPDPFRELDGYVHPHDPRYQEGLLYVSDSCRAWRDETLLQYADANPPTRILLTTHPEVWLGDEADRLVFLDRELMALGLRQHRDYFALTVREVWKTHPAPRKHDEREGSTS